MEIKIKVGGMSCSSCAKSIREGLQKVPGVKKTDVDLEKKLVTVETESDNVQEKVLKEKIADLGFDIL